MEGAENVNIWDDLILRALFTYRSTVHEFAGFTPRTRDVCVKTLPTIRAPMPPSFYNPQSEPRN